MNSRQRLMAALRGEPMDRPAVSFYEIGGIRVDAANPDPYNIYNSPSWQPLLRLAEEETDLIRMRVPWIPPNPRNARKEFFESGVHEEDGSRISRTTLKIGGRTMTSTSRRDRDVDTIWTTEHLLKNVDDLKAYLQLPDDVFEYGEPEVSHLIKEEEALGDRGIIMLDTGDPICAAASLFSMEDYIYIAYTERVLFHQLLEKVAQSIYPIVEKVSRLFPGHLWRVVGAEYATEPYLPPALFEEYVVRYTKPIIEMIRKHGGFARLHCHGKIRNALPHIIDMGADAIDPIEPPPLGDVDLDYVRKEYGRDLTLFGNLEVRDIETMEPMEFEKVVGRSLLDGTAGEGKGFILMPSACPYGRDIQPNVLANYETMVRLSRQFLI